MKRAKFSTAENRKKRVSKALAITALVVVIGLIVSFSLLNSVKYDKDAVANQATHYVDILNTRNYRAFYNALPIYMKYGKSANDWQDKFEPILASAGAFVEYSSIKTSGGIFNRVQSRSMRVTVTITAKYENATVVYTVAVTPTLQIVSLSGKKTS